MIKTIDDIINTCSDLFDRKLVFSPFNKDINRVFVISGDDLSPALNNHNGEFEPINTLKWFNNFWIYIEIEFKPIAIESKFQKGFDKKEYFKQLGDMFFRINNEYFNIIISISIFQGGYQENEKKQLFRAEWDNFDDNKIHPQPHWHVYPEENLKSGKDDISDFDIDDKDDFLEDASLQKIDLKRIHFAMNGEWAQNGIQIHKINNPKILVNWLAGVLYHIKGQLKETKTMRC